MTSFLQLAMALVLIITAAKLGGYLSVRIVQPAALGEVLTGRILRPFSGYLFAMEYQSAVFIGVILSATSVSISAQTLMELKVLRSRVGVGLLGSAVFDDILVLLGLSIFTALMQPSLDSGFLSILLIVVK